MQTWKPELDLLIHVIAELEREGLVISPTSLAERLDQHGRTLPNVEQAVAFRLRDMILDYPG